MVSTKALIFFVTYFVYLVEKYNSQNNKTICISESEAQNSYKGRINITINEAVNAARKCIKDNNFGSCSIWIAGACFVDSKNQENIEMGMRVASEFLKPFIAKLFEGGNDNFK